MLKKQYVKSRKVCKVTFELAENELPQDVEPEAIAIVGDFNDWEVDATLMKHVKSTGSYKAAIDLEPEQSYQFRYLINDSYWYNDRAACAYVPNSHGSQNSVVETLVA